jgi:hypothetical protein
MHLALSGIRTHNFSDDMHLLHSSKSNFHRIMNMTVPQFVIKVKYCIIKEKTGDLEFRSEWTVFRFTQGPVSSGFTVVSEFIHLGTMFQRKIKLILQNDKIFNLTVIFTGYLPSSPYNIKCGVEVFKLSNSLQNFTCTLSNMSIFSQPQINRPVQTKLAFYFANISKGIEL